MLAWNSRLRKHSSSSGVLRDTCRCGQSHRADTAERGNMCPGISIGNHRERRCDSGRRRGLKSVCLHWRTTVSRLHCVFNAIEQHGHVWDKLARKQGRERNVRFVSAFIVYYDSLFQNATSNVPSFASV